MIHPKSWNHRSLVRHRYQRKFLIKIMPPSSQYAHIYRLKERSLWMSLAQRPTDSGRPGQHDCNPDYCNHKQCDAHAFSFALTHLSAQSTTATPVAQPQHDLRSPAQPAEADPSASLPFPFPTSPCRPFFLSFFLKQVAAGVECHPSHPILSIHPFAPPPLASLTSSACHQVTTKLGFT